LKGSVQYDAQVSSSEKDYLAGLKERLENKSGDYVIAAKIISVEIEPGNKLGTASADLICNDHSVTVDHYGRRAIIHTPEPSAAAAEAKKHWSQMRGPKLRDRTIKEPPYSSATTSTTML
jgi:hypothetical protein